MRWLVRSRILLARRPWIVWLFVGTCSSFAALAVNAQVQSLRQAEQRWGETRTVLVASAPVSAGTPASAAALERRRLPVAAVPSGALDRLDDTAVVVRSLSEGEVVVPADVGRGDPRFALAPPGHVLVALARPEVLVLVAPGDSVDITTVDADGLPTTSRATVVALSDAALTVAVAPHDATRVATAATNTASPPGVVLVPLP